jgi:proteasome assembly chaperone (PAC2) family protein
MLGLKIHTLPKLDKPDMIAAIPDMGNVAGIGLGFLIKKLKAKLFAEIYAFWPPAVSYENGLIKYDQSSYKFHYCQKENLVIFSGKGQITGFNGLVTGIAKEKELGTVCILGEIDTPNVIQPKTAEIILSKLLQLLKLKPLDMKELEEEEKRKQFMEQQMNYMSGLAKRDNQPGIA